LSNPVKENGIQEKAGVEAYHETRIPYLKIQPFSRIT